MDRGTMIALRRGAFLEAIAAIEKHREGPWRACDEGERIGLGYAASDIRKLMERDADRVELALAAA